MVSFFFLYSILFVCVSTFPVGPVPTKTSTAIRIVGHFFCFCINVTEGSGFAENSPSY